MLLKPYLDQGVSKAELSRRFGVNRRTIHYWIETGHLDRDLSAGARGYTPRPPVAHKLDPYKEIIDARLEAFPKLSAKRLFDEVRAAGYPGGYKRVLDYVRATRPREPVEAPVRFETPAGRQGQVDFGTFTPPWGRRHALAVAAPTRLPTATPSQTPPTPRLGVRRALEVSNFRLPKVRNFRLPLTEPGKKLPSALSEQIGLSPLARSLSV